MQYTAVYPYYNNELSLNLIVAVEACLFYEDVKTVLLFNFD